MAEDDKTTAPGQRSRRQRPKPTIDLTATEVPSGQSDTGSSAPADSAAPADDAAPVAAEPAAPDSAQAGSDGVADSPRSSPPHSPSSLTGYLVAASAGAVLAAIVAIVLALTGYVPVRTADTTALTAQLAALDGQVKALASRAPPAPDRQAIDQLRQRIDQVAQAASTAPAGSGPADPALLGRIGAIESELKTLGGSLAALDRRMQNAAASADAATRKADAAAGTLQSVRAAQSSGVDAIERRLDALERAAKATQDKIATASGADKAARFALAAMALHDAVRSNAPFADQLSVVKALGGDPQAVAALEPFAVSGVPTDTALAADLKALLPEMIRTAGAATARPSGFIAKLEANAGRLVRIRPIDEPAGDKPAAVLERIELKLSHSDVAGAASELDKLPEKVRAAAEPWHKTFVARQAAFAASRKLSTDGAAALATR